MHYSSTNKVVTQNVVSVLQAPGCYAQEIARAIARVPLAVLVPKNEWK